MSKEYLNIDDIFEKYRKSITGPMIGWFEDESLEEYMEMETYGDGVMMFLEFLDVCTKNEYTIKKRGKDRTYDDTNWHYLTIKRTSDGKCFKGEVCIEYGDYTKDFKEK